MDLNREIKLSDVFKRRAKPEPELSAAEPREEGEKKSVLKRDVKLSLRRRKPGDAVAAAAEAPAAEARPAEAPVADKKSLLKRDLQLSLRRKAKEPKAAKEANGRRAHKGAAPIPEVPLMRAFNLLPKEDARGQRSGARRPSPAQLGIAVAALVLLAALTSIFLVTNAQVADKQRRYDELRSELAAKNLRVQDPAPNAGGDATLIQDRDARRAALSTALGSRIAWDRLLRDLSLVLPEDVWLKSLRGQSAAPPDPAQPAPTDASAAGKNTFELTGYARRQEDVALLLSRMGVLPEIESVTLVSSAAVELAKQELVEFTITAVVKPQGGTP